MKILFLLKSAKTPSSRIRILDIIPELESRGLKCFPEFVPKNFFARMRLFGFCKEFDAVVLQKRLLKTIEFFRLRSCSKKLLFDFDDAIYFKNASPSSNLNDYVSKTRMTMFRRIVSKSDIVVAANEILAEKAREFLNPSAKIHVIASPVKMDEIQVKESIEIKGKPVLGWIGTSVNLHYLSNLLSAFLELAKKQDFIVRIISDKPCSINGVETEFIKWSVETQNSEIRRFDIGLMPLSPDPFSEGKAAYKLIQYLAAGVPSVCSPVGMNKDFCSEEKYALPANNPSEFCNQISRLIGDSSLRKRLSEEGRKFVLTNFDIKTIAEKYYRALSELT